MSSGSYEEIEEVLSGATIRDIFDIALEEDGLRAVATSVVIVGCGVFCSSMAVFADALVALDYWFPAGISEACA